MAAASVACSKFNSNHTIITHSCTPVKPPSYGHTGCFRSRGRVLRRMTLNCCSSSVSPTPHNPINNRLDFVVEDDIHVLLQVLPADLHNALLHGAKLPQLLEVVFCLIVTSFAATLFLPNLVILDLGRLPQACYAGECRRQVIRNTEVTMEELQYIQHAVGEFGDDNRAGIPGTLHRVSAITNRSGEVIGLTCRVGRAIQGQISMVRDLLDFGESMLLVGRPGVGKTTVMREISRVMSDELQKRVVIVDTSNEIGGGGDVPHPAIGSARRLQVPESSMQQLVMIEAVENHMPEVIIVDEIGTDSEVYACRTIAERGVMLIGTAHGEGLESIIKNPSLSNLIGGVESITLGDQEARLRKGKKIILGRKATPTFPFLIEIRERYYWVVHRTERSVDALIRGQKPLVEIRRIDEQFKVVIGRWTTEN